MSKIAQEGIVNNLRMLLMAGARERGGWWWWVNYWKDVKDVNGTVPYKQHGVLLHWQETQHWREGSFPIVIRVMYLNGMWINMQNIIHI